MVHGHHVHVGQFVLVVVAVRRAWQIRLDASDAALDCLVVGGRREQVVRRRRRVRLVVAAPVGRGVLLLANPPQIAALVQFDRAPRVDRVTEEQLGARDHEEEQHEAAERAQVPYGGQRLVVQRTVVVVRVCQKHTTIR